MHIILTGSTGTIGSAVLNHLLASPAVSRLSILSRRDFSLPTGGSYDTRKATIIVHEDFLSYPDELLRGALAGAEACVWAQGTSQSQVGKEEYIRITHDFPIAAAKAFATLPTPGGRFNFVYVSGEGADQTEKAFMLFSRIKGRTERALLALPASSLSLTTLRIFNVRPSYVFPVSQDRRRPLAAKLNDIAIAPILVRLMPSKITPPAVLAKVLADLALGEGEALPAGTGVEDEGRVLRNVGIRRLGDETERKGKAG